MEKVDQFLDYAASQEQAVLTYKASDMVLEVHSDASYLSKSKARSRAGGNFFMSKDVSFPPNNGAVLNLSQIMKQSCPRPRKRKLEQCASIHANPYQLKKYSMKWATANTAP